MVQFDAPFSARHRGKSGQVDNAFPETARTALLHLLHDLVERRFVTGWPAVAQELRRVGRQPPVSYGSAGNADKQARADVDAALPGLKWEKVYDFCERLYGHLAQATSHALPSSRLLRSLQQRWVEVQGGSGACDVFIYPTFPPPVAATCIENSTFLCISPTTMLTRAIS